MVNLLHARIQAAYDPLGPAGSRHCMQRTDTDQRNANGISQPLRNGAGNTQSRK
jgi:hypothetical protein